MVALIISNGDIAQYEYYTEYAIRAGFIICADGSVRHANALGVRPDLVVGDFDSIKKEDFDSIPDDVVIIKYNREKDKTDTEIAIDIASDMKFSTLMLIGATGDRFDHSISNIFLLKKILEYGLDGVLITYNNEIRIINNQIKLSANGWHNISLVPITEEVTGITTNGLYYELDNETLSLGSSRGLSNEFCQREAEIVIKSGLLMVILSRE